MISSQKKKDIFKVDVGNLEYGESVIIQISYTMELDMEGDRIRFRIPQNIMPRYGADDETKYGKKVTWPVTVNIDAQVSSIYLGTKWKEKFLHFLTDSTFDVKKSKIFPNFYHIKVNGK